MPALPEPLPNERYVAVYDYTSDEAGDLHFSAGQVVRVVKKTSEWWTGQFGASIGVFPYNFVEPEGVRLGIIIIFFYYITTYNYHSSTITH